MTRRVTSVSRVIAFVPPGQSEEYTGGRVSRVEWIEGRLYTYHDTEKTLPLDFTMFILIKLNDLLNPGANRNEEPSRLSQLID